VVTGLTGLLEVDDEVQSPQVCPSVVVLDGEPGLVLVLVVLVVLAVLVLVLELLGCPPQDPVLEEEVAGKSGWVQVEVVDEGCVAGPELVMD